MREEHRDDVIGVNNKPQGKKVYDPDNPTVAISNSVPFGGDLCKDVLIESIIDWNEDEYRVEATPGDYILDTVAKLLTFGAVSFKPSKVLYRREHRTTQKWIENTCNPGEKRDFSSEDIITRDWYKPTKNAGHTETEIHEGGGFEIFGIPLGWFIEHTDISDITITKTIDLGDAASKKKPGTGEKQPDTNTSNGDNDRNVDGHTEAPSPEGDSPHGDTIYLTGYDDVLGSDGLDSNFLAKKGSKPEAFGKGKIFKGSDLLGYKYRPAMIGGTAWGSVSIKPNKKYEVVDMQFKATGKVVNDPNLIPMEVKYGYWALEIVPLAE